jgi:hypothetical protein
MQNSESPILEIILHLDPQLEAAIRAAAEQNRVISAVESSSSSLLEEIGLPSTTRVAIRAGIPGEHQAALLALEINGQSLPSTPAIENRLLAVVHARLLQPGEGGPAIPGWLVAAFQGSNRETKQAAIKYLAALSRAILGERPELLITQNQVHYLRESWSQQAPQISRISLAWLATILQELLAMHLPLGGDAHFLQLLLDERRSSPLEAAEAVIVAVLPKTLQIHLSRHLLRSHTLEDVRLPVSGLAIFTQGESTSLSSGAFYQMGQQFFADLGLNLPNLEFEINEENHQHFAFRINGLLSSPYPALPAGKVLVDATPQTLEMMNISAQAVLHPLDGRLCSLVELGDEVPPNEKGYFSWKGIEYLALCLGHTVHIQPCCLVHSQSLNTWLEEIKKNAPELVKAIHTAYPPGAGQATLVRTMRHLVQQGVSLAELPHILQTLLRAALLAVPSPEWDVYGGAMPASQQQAQSDWRSDPATLAAFVRWSLALPAISFSPADLAMPVSPRQVVSLEQYAEPLTQDERMEELAKYYSNEDIQHFLSLMAVVLQMSGQAELPEFVDEKLNELFVKLEIDSTTPLEEMLQRIATHFTENPVNPALIQDSTAAIRAEVPHNLDAFTTRWRSKYSR